MEKFNFNGYRAYAESNIGGRSENQDSFGWGMSAWGPVFTVCDGMGGGPAGKTASSIAVREILDYMANANIKRALHENVVMAVKQANVAVYDMAQTHQEMMGMGTTCTVLVMNHGEAVIAHVGDSRVYQLRGKNKRFRTFDHSMVFELVKQNIITEEQARTSAQSNVITRALGLNEDVDVEINTVKYVRGDRFMLTTDGIHGMRPEVELIKDATNHTMDIEEIVGEVSDTVNEMGERKGGGHDNNTIVLIETEEGGKESWLKALWRKIFAVAILSTLTIPTLAQTIEWKIAPGEVYDFFQPYHGNIWKARHGLKMSLVDINSGKPVALRYDSITNVSDGIALGIDREGARDKIVSVINISEKREHPLNGTFYAVKGSCCSEGLIAVADGKGMQGYIDPSGNIKIKFKYSAAWPFYNGTARVDIKNKSSYIDKNGKKVKTSSRDDNDILKNKLNNISTDEVNNSLILYREGNSYGYKSSDNVVIMPQFKFASQFYKDYAVVWVNDNKAGVIQLSDNPININTNTINQTTTKKVGKRNVKTTVKVEQMSISAPNPLTANKLKVTQTADDEEEKDVVITKQDDSEAFTAEVLPYNKEATIKVYYDGLLQAVKTINKPEQVEQKVRDPRQVTKPTEEVKPEVKATLTIGSISKRGAKADKNDIEYIQAVIVNPSNVTFAGTATIYVDGTPYTTKLSILPKKSGVATASVKVTKERFAKVYVQLSNGQKSAVKSINLKPFY